MFNISKMDKEICSLKKQRAILILLLVVISSFVLYQHLELNKTKVYVIDDDGVVPIENIKGV